MYIYIYIYIYIFLAPLPRTLQALRLPRRAPHRSRKHRSAPEEKCPWCLSLWGRMGDTPPLRNILSPGPFQAPWRTNTKVTSAKGPFCAYPNRAPPPRRGFDLRSGGSELVRSCSLLFKHVYIYIYIYLHTYIHIHILYVYTYLSLSLSIYIYIYNIYIYIYTHVYWLFFADRQL